MPDRTPSPRRSRIYDLAAPVYDAVSACIPFERNLRSRAVTLLGATPGSRILDVGCGTGLCLPELARALGPTGSVVGIDPSGASLLRARRRAHRLGCDFTAIQADVAAHPLEPKAFAGAIAAFALSVIPNWQGALTRIYAALPSGAVLVALEQRYPTRTGLATRLGAAMNKLLAADPERDFAGALKATGFAVDTHLFLGGWYAIYVASRTA